MFALLINASILILAAATFYKAGNTDVAELCQAQSLLHPLLGSAIAPTLFGIALLCCGLNSTVTATLAGQAVMEGFLHIRLPAWLRRLLTRVGRASFPPAGVTLFYGEGETAKLLILTQVILSLQLPFAIVPLVQFTANRRQDGRPCRAPVADGRRSRDRSNDHRPERQIDLRFCQRGIRADSRPTPPSPGSRRQ